MSDQSKEIAELRNELETLKTAFSTSLIMLQATHHLAMSLAKAHHDGASVADAFEAMSTRGGDFLLNSLASDADLKRAEVLNAGISKFLRSTR